MRPREQILEDLTSLNKDALTLQKELNSYPWDVEQPLTTLSKTKVLQVLARVIGSEVKMQNLEDWANVIECRDDIGFETEELRQLIFELANPQIYETLTIQRVQEIIFSVGNDKAV